MIFVGGFGLMLEEQVVKIGGDADLRTGRSFFFVGTIVSDSSRDDIIGLVGEAVRFSVGIIVGNAIGLIVGVADGDVFGFVVGF